MGITVEGVEEIKLLDLLRKMDEGYVPTEEEQGYLEKIDEFGPWLEIIDTLPESIGKLINLQSLDLSGTEISTLPESIGELINLRLLCIFGTKVSTLPESIGKLIHLQSLDLSDTQISTLSESIGKLINLQLLDLSNTKISTLPESIGKLIHLQTLYLPGTKISTLPESIGKLIHLQSLNLSGTEINILPECIGTLAKLRVLDFSYTQISTLPEFISKLINLQSLGVCGTQIDILPEFIGNLSNLRHLDLFDMHLQQIPRSVFELGIDFSFDRRYVIDARSGINLWDTTLSTQPISLFRQPRDLIAAYYDAPKVTLKDAKVIFLGDGGVGKSRTIKRILNGGEPGDYPTELTPGIDITDYSVIYNGQNVNLRIWDFGGQEIMHAMHRCFLTDRTCYVVMVNNRTGNRTQRARYWLKTIDSFAKNCPVILAVNLWDTDDGIGGINEELLEREFPNVRKIITYSAKGSDKDHFNRLTDAIAEQASQLDSYGMEFPVNWDKIRTELSERAESERYISKTEYLEICRKCGEADPQICGWLLEWFNDLGVCFSYHSDKKSGQELESYQVLSPRWLVNAVYLMINKGNHNGKIERRIKKRGVIDLELIQNLLESGGGTAPEMRYEERECGYILSVMRKFHLSYPVDEEHEFIPALCPDKWEKAPQTEGWDNHVTYEMRYRYLPDNVLHRLMIFCLEHRILEQAWSGGMELSDDMNRYHAVIYLREEESTLEVNVYAKEGRKSWEYLEILRKALNQINTDLNLQAEDVIVMKKNKQTAHFPVASVLKAVERHIPALYSMDDGELEEYRVDEILGLAFDMKKVEEEKKKAREEKRPMSEQNITYNNNITYNISGDSYGNQYYNSTVGDTEAAEKFLRQILEHKDRVTEQLVDQLLDILKESREEPVQILMKNVDREPKENRRKMFFDWLSGGVDFAANMTTVAGAIAPHLPELVKVAASFLGGF